MGILDLLFPKTCLECGEVGAYICPNCLKKVRKANFANSNNYAIFRYEGVIRKAIIALKYKFSTEIAKELAAVCAKNLKGIKNKKIVLVPIPLHRHRENLRGFNQSEIVGSLIAEKMHWKFEPNLLKRKKATKPQVQLRGEERKKNLHGVFELNPELKLPPSTQILIFDDVYTTGSTINETKRVLEANGFKGVRSLTIAR